VNDLRPNVTPKLLAAVFELESSESGSDQSKASCIEYVQALSTFGSTHQSWASAEDIEALAISVRTLERDAAWFPEYACSLIFVGPKMGSFSGSVDQVWLMGLDNWDFRIHWCAR
jgi:hypothetical protein